jgi:ABC-type spermidine/putrescine transport system permease subunit II
VLPEVVFALGLLVLFTNLHLPCGFGATVLGHVLFLSPYPTILPDLVYLRGRGGFHYRATDTLICWR